jgi:hypothetical protein
MTLTDGREEDFTYVRLVSVGGRWWWFLVEIHKVKSSRKRERKSHKTIEEKAVVER